MAEASVFVMDLDLSTYRANTLPMQSHINVGMGNDISIAELADIVARVVGFQRQIIFDPSKPDGAPRKLMDSTRLNQMGWRAKVDLEAGLATTYRQYVESQV